MKRICRLICALVCCLSLISTVAFASDVDINDLTPERQMSLLRELQLKFYSEALIEGCEIPKGTYLVGQDIPAGRFEFYIDQNMGWFALTVYTDDIENPISTGSLNTVLAAEKDSCTLVLEEGQYIEIRDKANQGVMCKIRLFPSLFGK